MSAPRSLRARLLLGGFAGVGAAALLAAWLLGAAFERIAERSFERALGNELASLVGKLEASPDGGVSLRQRPTDARYERALSGAYWQVGSADGAQFSRSLWDAELALPPGAGDGRRETLRIDGPAGQRLMVVRQRVSLPRADAPVEVLVAADLAPLAADAREFRWMAATGGAVVAALLTAVLLLQVQVGLRPLRDLARDLADLRRGARDRLGGADPPAEIRPLVGHLDALLAHHARSLERARNASADLAHALKTPLAAIDAAAQSGAADLPAVVRSQVARMRAAVERRLASGIGGGFLARTPVAATARSLARMLAALHPDRHIEVRIDEALQFPGSVEDLEELLGNLVENACKWGRSRVEVSARTRGDALHLCVDDDGAGLAPTAATAALERGTRLDEQAPGSGLGLAIVRELAEAHGGGVELGRSPLGGLRAEIRVPLPH